MTKILDDMSRLLILYILINKLILICGKHFIYFIKEIPIEYTQLEHQLMQQKLLKPTHDLFVDSYENILPNIFKLA